MIAVSETLNVSIMKLEREKEPVVISKFHQLRGVTLFGITSQNTRMAERISIWNKLSDEYAVKHLSTVIREITLTELPDAIREMREGKLRGRVLVNLWK